MWERRGRAPSPPTASAGAGCAWRQWDPRSKARRQNLPPMAPLPSARWRTRTGVLLAASSLAASFLGQQAFQNPTPRGLAIAALVAFVVSIAASVFILLPKKNLVFAEAGAGLYEGLYAFRNDMPEVYRRAGHRDPFLGRLAGRYHFLKMADAPKPQPGGTPPPPPPPTPGLGRPETHGGSGRGK